MIKIVNHKSEQRKIAVKFTCNCGCEFWADNESLLNDETTRVSHYTVYSAICPDCKNKVCSINKPVEREIVFDK